MKVVVDHDKCTGHARCHAIASDVFELDDEGYNAINDLTVPTALEPKARDGADACPEGAITIVE